MGIGFVSLVCLTTVSSLTHLTSFSAQPTASGSLKHPRAFFSASCEDPSYVSPFYEQQVVWIREAEKKKKVRKKGGVLVGIYEGHIIRDPIAFDRPQILAKRRPNVFLQLLFTAPEQVRNLEWPDDVT
jgi:hypothetical protein